MLKLRLRRMRPALLGMRKEDPLQLSKHLFPQITWSVLKVWDGLCIIVMIVITINGSGVLFFAMRRKSKQREAILRLLKGTTSHPTADWIYEQVRAEIPNISLGTVYRNLRLLKQEGKILELDLAGIGRFDGNTQDHYHFRCERCGRIFNVDEPVHKEMDEEVAKRMGFKVFNHVLEFRGLCQDCHS